MKDEILKFFLSKTMLYSVYSPSYLELIEWKSWADFLIFLFLNESRIRVEMSWNDETEEQENIS